MSFRRKSSANKNYAETNEDDSKKSTKSNRRHKSKSLVVPPSNLSDNYDGYGASGSKSADADSPSIDLRHRFSFRGFRRGRSLSKSRFTDTQSPTKESFEINACCGERSGVNNNKHLLPYDETLATSPLPSPPIRKSHSVVDFRSFCSKIHRHLTTGTIHTQFKQCFLFSFFIRITQQITVQ